MGSDTWLKLCSAQYLDSSIEALLKSLQPGQLDPESPRREAERALAAHLGINPAHLMLTGSCTAALEICYHFLGGRDQALEAPVLTWPSTYSYAPHKNLVDTCPNGWPQWSDRDDVVRVLVALWGRPIPREALPEAPGAVILDAAHAFGTGLDLLATGSAQAVCYSFGVQKEIPCVRGGAIVSPSITADWRAYRDSGTSGRHPVYPHGRNYGIPESFAALLLHQLTMAQQWWAYRQVLLTAYAEQLKESPIRLLTPPGSSGHLCVIQLGDETQRMLAQAHLYDAKIQTSVHYNLPVWMPQVAYPQAWWLSRTILSLPLHVHMEVSDVERVVKALAYSQP